MAPIPPKTVNKKPLHEPVEMQTTTDDVTDPLGRYTLTQLLKKEKNTESGDISEIHTAVQNIETAVSSIQSTVNSLSDRMSSLELRVAALEQSASDAFTEVWEALLTVVNSKMAGSISDVGATYSYMRNMYDYAEQNSGTLYDATVFSPVLAQSGTLIQNTARAKQAQTAWLLAMCIAEICPKIQNDLYHVGYSIVGSADTQTVYGYQLNSDVNIARMVASVLFAMHRPDAATQEAAARAEIAAQDTGNALGTTRGSSIPTHSEETLAAVADGTKFMPSTPKNASSNPDFAFDESTWDYVIANYTYSNGQYSNARAQQAVSDSSATDMTAQKQMFQSIGITMTTAMENLVTPCYKWGSRIATPMKDGFDSVSQITYPGYASNPRTDAEFRMRPFEFHNVHLLDPNDSGASYLNTSSYPSGHTSFGWNIALIMIECNRRSLSDVKTIMTRYFQFGQSRVIGRYHWQADVYHGYVIGSCCIPRLHSYYEYITLLGNVG